MQAIHVYQTLVLVWKKFSNTSKGRGRKALGKNCETEGRKHARESVKKNMEKKLGKSEREKKIDS